MHLSASLGTVIDDERDERRRDANTHPPRSPFTFSLSSVRPRIRLSALPEPLHRDVVMGAAVCAATATRLYNEYSCSVAVNF